MPRLINNKEQQWVEKTDVTEIDKKNGEKRVIVWEEGKREKSVANANVYIYFVIFLQYIYYIIFSINPHCAFFKKMEKN